MPYIAAADIAAVAAKVLESPEAHAGQTYLLTGPVAVTDAHLAEVLTELSGRPIAYVDQSLEDLATVLTSQGTTQWYVDHLVGFEAWKPSGNAVQTTNAVPSILGRPALTPREALARYQDSL